MLLVNILFLLPLVLPHITIQSLSNIGVLKIYDLTRQRTSIHFIVIGYQDKTATMPYKYIPYDMTLSALHCRTWQYTIWTCDICHRYHQIAYLYFVIYWQSTYLPILPHSMQLTVFLDCLSAMVIERCGHNRNKLLKSKSINVFNSW